MKYSAVISTYNRTDYISDILISLDRNGFKEVLIIEAGDDDAFREIKRSVSKVILSYEPVIHWAHGCSLGKSRNLGAFLCTGDYIFFSDDDDVFSDSKIRSFENHLDGSLVYTHGYQSFYGSFNGSQDIDVASRKFGPMNIIPRYLRNFWANSYGGGSSIIAKRSVLEVIPFDETYRSCEDVEWFSRLALAGVAVKYIDEPLTFYRQHGSRMSGNRFKNVKWELLFTARLVKIACVFLLGAFLKLSRAIVRACWR